MNIAFFGDSLTAGKPGCSYVPEIAGRYPGNRYFNYGVCGASVGDVKKKLSSIRSRTDEKPKYDIAFLFIGVNDIIPEISPFFKITKHYINRRPVFQWKLFTRQYREALIAIKKISGRCVILSPFLIGENLDNPWNRRLDLLVKEMEKLCREEYCPFINLREEFCKKFDFSRSSDFLARNSFVFIQDQIVLRKPEAVDAKAKERGLQTTLDGIHLNHKGALFIADILAPYLEESVSD